MSDEEKRLLKQIEALAQILPKFPDGRIDYTSADTAPVICVFLKLKDKILLLKRSEKVLAYPEKWNTVVGFIDEAKPIREKALEEIGEELAVSEKSILSVDLGRSHKVEDKNIGRTWIVYPVLVELKEEPQIKLDWEHTEFKWIKPEELKGYDTPPKLEKSMENALKAGETNSQHSSVKVAIVGAGIVGTYLAWRFAKKGFDVSVFEQKSAIGGKTCSGLISKRIWHFFPEEKSVELNEIKSAAVRFPEKDVEIEFSPRMLVLDRKKLEEYAAELAKEAGAKIFLGMKAARVLHVKGKKPQLALERSGKKAFLEFDYVIGCDGANSVVRKSLHLREPKLRVGILCFGKGRKNQGRGAVEVFPSESGFSWIIQRSSGEAEYGTLEKPAEAKEEFLKFCRKQKIKPESAKAAPIPEGLTLPDNERITLCGDAAGLTKSWSGGGVIWGLTAAHMLARDFPDMKKYESRLRRFFAPKMLFGKLETKLAVWLGFHAPALLPKRIRIDSDWGI